MASRSPVGKEFWLAALRAEGSAFLAAVSQPGVLSRRVPSCPDWSVGELVRHLGAFYQRIRLNAGSAGADEAWPALTVPEEAPTADDEAVVTWFREQLQSVEAHLESLDPDLPTWNWAPRARVAAFWHRRAAHETAVHRWDAQVATRLPEPLESKLAGERYIGAGLHVRRPALSEIASWRASQAEGRTQQVGRVAGSEGWLR